MSRAAFPGNSFDQTLFRQFHETIQQKVPAVLPDGSLSNPTPLLDITEALISAGREEYGLELSSSEVKVYGKLEGEILGGSVKTRPAVQIIREAIASGVLARDNVVFEATSGNFGISLGLMMELGLKVIVLVSRKLQAGVLKALEDSDVRTIDLDVDICPAPGIVMMDANLAVAKGVAQSVRAKLAEYGLDLSPFDGAGAQVEGLLARQDVIGLAQLLARIYGGFCPEQYDNEQNPTSHMTVTGPEIDSQLRRLGASLAEFDIVCTFGTGGTSTGLSRYIQKAHRRKGVRVVFPLEGQDVAGIRTKSKASGLRFYRPELYMGEHTTDFEAASRLLDHFWRRGIDIGESSALALYATLQLVNYGAGKKFVVVLADGAEKYRERAAQKAIKSEVSLDEARFNPQAYDAIIWTHGMFTPKEEGIQLLAAALGCEPSRVKVAKIRDVQSLVNGGGTPQGILEILPQNGRNALLVCMVGGTSLMAAKYLSAKGFNAQSLKGGIMGIAASRGKAPAHILKPGD
jgi:cysteine synthase/rhodanese-related sulfurtransferase